MHTALTGLKSQISSFEIFLLLGKVKPILVTAIQVEGCLTCHTWENLCLRYIFSLIL